ncbi:amino acid adenylation domain-containing protein [Streptomyces phytohabitans]|uniref:non-ribosomal peptide synthetase n=1 Tax=Streptomyces phytohabitans TaxID=1150371 RepID=UPI00345C0A20
MSVATWQFTGGRVDHGPYRPVAALIERQTDLTPDRPALTHPGEGGGAGTTLTYAEFDGLANGLAAELAARGVGAGSVVPVVTGNSLELPLCMVASLKVGAAFTLCDPAWPEERLRAVLSGAPLVLAARPLPYAARPALVVAAGAVEPRTVRPGAAPGPDAPAYGVFTSGSTGTPKCALNTHGGLANRLRFMSRWFRATGDEVVLQNSRHTFDSAIWQLLWPLTTGGRAVVPEQGEFLDLERTVAAIHRHRVTVTDFVPAILGMLVALLEAEPAALDRIRSLRHLVVGGEEIIPHAVHRLREMLPGLEITNGYGPSETAIGMVFHRVTGTEGDHIPLGRPIDNCYAVIASDDLGPLPAGSVGEILVGGACLGAGYLGDPERTAEVFVPNPVPGVPGDRLYRTGDLGWYDADGLLRFSGRRDRQAQVDGVRIELAEVETAAESRAGVVQAKALTLRRGGRTRLVLAASAEGNLAPAALRAHLASVLPRLQVPWQCFVLPSLPLSDNGKVDLRELRRLVEEKLAADATRRAPPAPADASPAARIAYEMGAVLDLPGFGTGDDFLARGGDSLAAVAAAIRIGRVTGTGVGMSDLYRHRTPAALAAALLERPAAHGDAAAERAALERDSALPAELAALAAGARRADDDPRTPPYAMPETVLVTGATGFVGARAVHRLLSATGVRVVCLVRARDDDHARHRVLRVLRAQGLWREAWADRLAAVGGDLAARDFGWRRPVWEAYARSCDAVLHAGALVNFLLDYDAHRPANVLGTAEVLRFALAVRPKHLHHVSTLGVLDRHAEHTGQRLDEDADPAAATVPASGYSRSKWVAERLLAAARRLGAPVTVHRLGEMMPAADNGVPNEKALTHLLLTAFVRLGVRPDVPMPSDWTPVDEAAARLVAALGEPPTGAVYHVYRPGSVDFAAVDVGAGPRRVPCGDFLAAVRAGAEGAAGGGTGGGTDPSAAALHALLAELPPTGPGGLPDLRRLLADNPALFTRRRCAALDTRHGVRGGPLDAAVAAYRGTLTGSTPRATRTTRAPRPRATRTFRDPAHRD